MLRENEELPRCRECGHPVDKHGRSVCTRGLNGKIIFHVIRLCGLNKEERARARDLIEGGPPAPVDAAAGWK
jgi:hypothetical protein